jgi:hypothetical protein
MTTITIDIANPAVNSSNGNWSGGGVVVVVVVVVVGV